MATFCEKCGGKIPRSANRYVNRYDKTKVKCVQCVIIEANAGQDLTVHPDDKGRRPTKQ